MYAFDHAQRAPDHGSLDHAIRASDHGMHDHGIAPDRNGGNVFPDHAIPASDHAQHAPDHGSLDHGIAPDRNGANPECDHAIRAPDYGANNVAGVLDYGGMIPQAQLIETEARSIRHGVVWGTYARLKDSPKEWQTSLTTLFDGWSSTPEHWNHWCQDWTPSR